ncbi:MAG: pentapeptide repeat-containing protein [Cyanobacteria bacterium J06649_5]
MKAKELLRRYNKGERDFREVDLSGESLRGMTLAGIDLSGANLSHTDLRGTKFTGAKLIGTQLCETKTGSQRRWLIPSRLLSLALSGLGSALLSLFVAFFLDSIISPSGKMTGSVAGDVAFGMFGLAVIAVTLYFNYRQGIMAALSAFAFAVGVAISASVPGSASGAAAFTFAAAIGGSIAGASAFAGSIAVAGAGSIVGSIAGSVTGAGATNSSNQTLLIGVTVVIVLLITRLNWTISRRALLGDPRDKLIRDLAIGLTSVGGTRFDNADLTGANFSKATLTNAHFKAATVRRTCFHLSKQIHLSRAYKTPLANRTALNLLVSLRPEPNTTYSGLNLQGAHLANANLADLDLTETDLSGATLAGADLQRTTLTKVQALGTNFYQANLTAACVESWNIDSTTQLTGALCEHVYLLRNQQERRPNSGTFEPGEFSELFEEVLNTIDLIFRDGMDWQAFMQTFQTIQVEHQGADLEIQSIEKKGNGVMVVRLNTHPDADKPMIHGAFKQEYELKLAAMEQEYKSLLASKEQVLGQKKEIIELYRQKSADMTTIAQSLAQRPVTVDVKAVASSKTGDETINIQGNVDGSVVRIGDGDDAPSA